MTKELGQDRVAGATRLRNNVGLTTAQRCRFTSSLSFVLLLLQVYVHKKLFPLFLSPFGQRDNDREILLCFCR